MTEKERMQIIAENITYYRKSKKITQKELAAKIGIKPSTLSDYINLRSAPSFGVIQKLADYFEVKKSDIDTTFKEDSPTPTNPQAELIPSTLQKITSTSSQLEHSRQLIVLNTAETQLEQQNTVTDLFSYNYYDQPASAGTGQYLNDVQVETIELPVDYDADFVIPVYGDSMKPEYHSGDYVFVKLSVELVDGDIGVFEYYGDAYIKQLLINADGAFLHSLNSKYEDIPVDRDSDFRIIGEVVGRYREK